MALWAFKTRCRPTDQADGVVDLIHGQCDVAYGFRVGGPFQGLVKLQASRVEAGHDSLSQVDVDSFLVSDHRSSCQIQSQTQFLDSDLKSGPLPLSDSVDQVR
jgi:hypothetical protein